MFATKAGKFTKTTGKCYTQIVPLQRSVWSEVRAHSYSNFSESEEFFLPCANWTEQQMNTWITALYGTPRRYTRFNQYGYHTYITLLSIRSNITDHAPNVAVSIICKFLDEHLLTIAVVSQDATLSFVSRRKQAIWLVNTRLGRTFPLFNTADRLAPASTQLFVVLSHCTTEKVVLIQLILVTSVSYLFYITKYSGDPLPALHSDSD